MHIASIRHKGLQQLYEDDNAKSIRASLVDKLRKQLLAIETATCLDDLAVFPGWRLHPLKGNLAGFWSLTVTGNWRMIFQYDDATNTASIMDLIDYH